jgi:4,5-dihydroxyphthalate decarboxylase
VWQTERISAGDSLDAALERGDLDAILVPRVPDTARRGGATPLFRDPETAMRQYFSQTGVFPIMHTIVVKEDVLAEHPDLPAELSRTFDDAKTVAYDLWQDPNWCLLADATDRLRSQRAWLGEDPYPSGYDANAPAIERLVSYERDLSLITEDCDTSSLFVPA